MPTNAKLVNWSPANKRWRKQYKGEVFWLCRGRGSSDRESYRKSVAEFKRLKAARDRQIALGNVAPVQTRATKPVSPQRKPSKSRHIFAAIDRFLEMQRGRAVTKNISHGRVQNLKGRLQRFRDFCGDGMTIPDITEEVIADFKTKIVGEVEGGRKPSTARADLVAARQFIRWLWKEHALKDLPRNLSELEIRVEYTPIPAFTEKQVRTLFNGATGLLKCAIALAVNCGYNQKDLSDLQRDEVDLRAGRIVRKRSKTGAYSNHKLWDVTVQLLKENMVQKNPTGRVFLRDDGNPLIVPSRDDADRMTGARTDIISGQFTRLRDKVLPDDKRTFRALRSTGATFVERITKGVEDLFLAHKPSTVAKTNYVLPDVTALDQALMQVDRKLLLRTNTLDALLD